MGEAMDPRDRGVVTCTASLLARDADVTATSIASVDRRSRATLYAVASAVACLAATATVYAAPVAPNWSLLPRPVEARPAPSGSVIIADGALIAVRGAHRDQLQPIADRFARRIADTRGLTLTPASASAAHAAITFELEPDASVLADDAYRIAVGPTGIRVSAHSAAGAFYGSVTLWQLLTPPGWVRGAAAEVSDGVIDDHPRFAWRALLLDSGRHFQSVADIERLIDWMSLEKLNVLLWHLTEDQGWRLEIPKYPELTRTGACRKAVGRDIDLTGGADRPYCGFYTEADARAIVRYAASRFVTVVPEIDLPGHSQAAVAAYPWLGVTGERPPVWTDWGISPWLLKPDEKTLRFVDDVLDEVMRLFPSRYISIGGDEAEKRQWNASPELRARMQQLGLANMDQLQAWFTGRIADHLVAHGRRPVGWDDELVAGATLPASEVVMSWHGSDGERVALEAAARGHDVVLAPQESLYFDHYQSDLAVEGPGQPPMTTLRQAYDTAVIPTRASAAQAGRIIGVQGCLWTEFMATFARDQHALYPRVAALSELGWSPESAHDWKGFLDRLPAELARYRALGIRYADTPFAPSFDVATGDAGALRVEISNQTAFGEIRYTTDGSRPTMASPAYTRPLEFPARDQPTLQAATFGPDGAELARSRARPLDASVLLSRDSGALASCSGRPATRLESDRRSQGERPVYALSVGDMCWLWHQIPAASIADVHLTVDRMAWRFGDEASEAIVRPKASASGEFEVHAGSCAGPLVARLPLAPGMQPPLPQELSAKVSMAALGAARDLCIFATGDPREGQWVLARVALSS